MVWSIALLVVLMGADQLLKYWTVTHLALGESALLLPGVLQLTRLHNYGAAWSSLSGKTVVLLVITGVLMAAVAYLLLKDRPPPAGGDGGTFYSGRRSGKHDRPDPARVCGGYAGHLAAV